MLPRRCRFPQEDSPGVECTANPLSRGYVMMREGRERGVRQEDAAPQLLGRRRVWNLQVETQLGIRRGETLVSTG